MVGPHDLDLYGCWNSIEKEKCLVWLFGSQSRPFRINLKMHPRHIVTPRSRSVKNDLQRSRVVGPSQNSTEPFQVNSPPNFSLQLCRFFVVVVVNLDALSSYCTYSPLVNHKIYSRLPFSPHFEAKSHFSLIFLHRFCQRLSSRLSNGHSWRRPNTFAPFPSGIR